VITDGNLMVRGKMYEETTQKKKEETTYYTRSKDSYTIKGNKFTINLVIEEKLLESHRSLELPQAIIHFNP
jgi:hypothetical protein